MSALKRQHYIAPGNVIGSNICNLQVALALPGLIRHAPCNPLVMTRDHPVLKALTVAVF